MEMKKTKVKMNQRSISAYQYLILAKYDYIKPKYQGRAKFCYMDADGFIIHIKTEDFYKEIANEVEKWFDTFNYDENDKRPLPIGQNKKVIGLFKDELGGKIVKEFVVLRAKINSYLTNDASEHKKAKGAKKCVIKRRLLFENYTGCLFNDKTILKSQQRFKMIVTLYILNKSIRLH